MTHNSIIIEGIYEEGIFVIGYCIAYCFSIHAKTIKTSPFPIITNMLTWVCPAATLWATRNVGADKPE